MSTIKYVLNDPTTPDLVIEVPLPAKPGVMDFRVEGFSGPVTTLWTLESQAANCFVTLTNAIQRVANHKPGVNHWAATQTLVVRPRAGQQFNAFYDRSGLHFFYATDPVMKKVIYSVDSREVVAHELGHAILDAYRPDLYNLQALEVWAFHEGFGDVHAILDGLYFDVILDRLSQLDPRQSNLVTKLAEEMGHAIYDITGGKRGYSSASLRDAVNNYHYTEPERLAMSGMDNQLLGEPHSFGRVWLGAWWDLFCSIYEVECKNTDKRNALVIARDVMFNYTFAALPLAPATVRFYDGMARAMMVVDKTNGYKYNEVMNSVFMNRGILKTTYRPLLAINWEMAKGFLSGDKEILEHPEVTAVRRKNIDLLSLPHHMLNVEVPNDSYYEFDKTGNCVDVIDASPEQLIDHANACVKYLNDNHMIRPDKASPFEISDDGKLLRTHFACDCFINNSVFPGAPEFGKGWKRENNSGCCPCACCNKKEEPRPRPKVGCYTRYVSGGRTVLMSGQTRSIRVC